MWIAAISAAVTGAGRGRGAVPCPSPYFWTQKSSRVWTSGMRAKLYTGGGEGMLHSSVRPSQGSGLATSPDRAVLMTFTMKTTNDSAMVNAPIVETRFQKFQPRSGAYV